jgi:hypothetical protein
MYKSKTHTHTHSNKSHVDAGEDYFVRGSREALPHVCKYVCHTLLQIPSHRLAALCQIKRTCACTYVCIYVYTCVHRCIPDHPFLHPTQHTHVWKVRPWLVMAN